MERNIIYGTTQVFVTRKSNREGHNSTHTTFKCRTYKFTNTSFSAGQYFNTLGLSYVFHWTIYRIVEIFDIENIVLQYLSTLCMLKMNVMTVYSLHGYEY